MLPCRSSLPQSNKPNAPIRTNARPNQDSHVRNKQFATGFDFKRNPSTNNTLPSTVRHTHTNASTFQTSRTNALLFLIAQALGHIRSIFHNPWGWSDIYSRQCLQENPITSRSNCHPGFDRATTPAKPWELPIEWPILRVQKEDPYIPSVLPKLSRSEQNNPSISCMRPNNEHICH